MQNHLAELMADAARVASHTAQNDPAGNSQSNQRQDIEQQGTEEGSERRIGHKPVECFATSPAQGKPRNEFRQEACNDDASHPDGRMTVEVAKQNHQMIAERRQLGERELEALGQQAQKICSSSLSARYRLRRGRDSPHGRNGAGRYGHTVS
ncbi:MAG: hypothetical protein J0H97_18125 [Alphaproteobacteria bacterium]|nr:hypothetical protein [Alphaproteobacteria bacterium]